MNAYDKKYLSPTEMINCDHRDVIDYAANLIRDVGDDAVRKAVKLYYAVRDGIWYDPYSPFYLPEHYRASTVLERGRGYCVQKASLLCALGRACGIPSRLGFADVRNHLATRQLIAFFGCDLFVYHGFVEFYLEDKWVKATPAFNRELCYKHKVKPLEFNGLEDSIFHEYNEEKKQFMEYVSFRGTYDDVPLQELLSAWEDTYGGDRVEKWISDLKETEDETYRNFDSEDVVKI